MIDLHVHSNRSDGTFTPAELVDYAIQKGLSAFALTDHDTVEGLEEAMEYAQKLCAENVFILQTATSTSNCSQLTSSPEYKAACFPVVPQIIPGIEFSTEYQGRDIHIVGLNIDYKNPEFAAYLRNFVDSRILRNQKMCARLQEAGIDITYEKLLADSLQTLLTSKGFDVEVVYDGET